MSYLAVRRAAPLPFRPYRPGRGLGRLGFTYYDLLNASGIENCDPRDSVCVDRNTERANATEDLWVSTYMAHADTANQPTPQISLNLDTSPAAVNAFNNNTPTANYGISVNGGPVQSAAKLETMGPYAQAVLGGANPVAAKGGQLTFTTSRGGTSFYPGDTWQISISGATPNTQVTVKGGKVGDNTVTAMGTTDAAGNFAKSGTFAAGDAGSWSESWAVGSAPAGSFSFTLSASAPPAAVTPAGQVIINSSGPPAGSTSPGSVIANLLPAGWSLSSIPTVAWVGVAAVVLVMVAGGKK